jgi:serine/threonine-protein kinase
VKHTEYGGAYGFISSRRGDVFFHRDSVYGPERVQVADRVVFASYDGGGAPRAHPVIKLNADT